MISILIPVYNQDIRKLVHQLVQQASESAVAFEIIARDDGSSGHFKNLNRSLIPTPCFSWIENTSNKGRSITRNLLAKEANFDFLLFLDCDVQLKSSDFLAKYINYIHQKYYGLVAGGCQYESSKPEEQRYLLHWTYGTKVENPAGHRFFSTAKKHFHSVNFMINKEIILLIPFQESITTYGHEDSLWEHDLISKRIQIVHIQNPVLHLGLNTTKQFLRNTASAIKNVILLNKEGINFRSNLLRLYDLLLRLNLVKLYFKFYRKTEKLIVRNLMSQHPKIGLLSIFKLGLLIRFYSKSNPER